MANRRVGEFEELKTGDKYMLIGDDDPGYREVIESHAYAYDENIWVVKFTSPRVSQSPRKASNISVFVIDQGVVNFSDLKPGDNFKSIPDDGTKYTVMESLKCEYPYLIEIQARHTPVFVIRRHR